METTIQNHDLVPGQKVRFMGVMMFWFNDVVANGKKLRKYDIFTVKTVKEWSSWTEITLEETGDLKYNSAWFRPYEDPYRGRDITQEVIDEMLRTGERGMGDSGAKV